MIKIPFSQPLIDEDVVAEVIDSLVNTGWLTSGPKVQALEAEVRTYTGAQAVVCVNSWTSGAMLALKWFGVGPGDEVIIPAYTYAATALCALNIGATVVMVDVLDDFTLNPALLEKAITPRTKAIIPVDLGGWPADYDRISAILEDESVRARFRPATQVQEKLGRPLILADAAHSIGAVYKGRKSGTCADISVLSFHSVKNITTGEGGAVCLQLPPVLDPQEEYRFLKLYSLNGQTKSTFEKNIPGDWR
jgi:dTDP-4-amino-4,6-dideoxygalactose transaminase